jgi:hypothetical protein
VKGDVTTLSPFSVPTRYATRRRAVGQAAANPVGAGKWRRLQRHRGGACAPRPCACLRGFSLFYAFALFQRQLDALAKIDVSQRVFFRHASLINHGLVNANRDLSLACRFHLPSVLIPVNGRLHVSSSVRTSCRMNAKAASRGGVVVIGAANLHCKFCRARLGGCVCVHDAKLTPRLNLSTGISKFFLGRVRKRKSI